MANTYSNTSLQIHEVAGTPYNQAPDIYMSITTGVTVRSGNTVKLAIESASLNGLSGLSYFGYTLTVYASLDDGTVVQLFSKPASPNQWSSGTYRLETPVEIASTNVTTATSLKIWFESTCDCNSGARAVVQQIALTAPPVGCIWRYHDGAWHKELQVKKFTGGAWVSAPSAKKRVNNGWVDL